MNTKNYPSTLEICRERERERERERKRERQTEREREREREREGNGSKNIESQLFGISNFVAAETRYHSA